MCSPEVPEESILISPISLLLQEQLPIPDTAATITNVNSLLTFSFLHASVFRKINPAGINTPQRDFQLQTSSGTLWLRSEMIQIPLK